MLYQRLFLALVLILMSTACEEKQIEPGPPRPDLDADAVDDGQTDVTPDDTLDDGSTDPCEARQAICTEAGIRNCTTGEVTSCAPGFCVENAGQITCATEGPECARDDGTLLLCATAEGEVDTTRACDMVTGQCLPVDFDCAELDSELQCPNGSDFLTQCVAGQPFMAACSQNEALCGADDSVVCVAKEDEGSVCGHETLCKPGAHCVQSSASAPGQCIRPAGILNCSQTDVHVVCTDEDTAFVCLYGFIFEYRNLTSWGGRCEEASNTVTVPVGGNCFPGLVSCVQGARCEENLVGSCVEADPNADPECALLEASGLADSCNYEWGNCANGKTYQITCVPQGIQGQVWSDCDCKVNGSTKKSFTSTVICDTEDLTTLDGLAKSECGWDITTLSAP